MVLALQHREGPALERNRWWRLSKKDGEVKLGLEYATGSMETWW